MKAWLTRRSFTNAEILVYVATYIIVRALWAVIL